MAQPSSSPTQAPSRKATGYVFALIFTVLSILGILAIHVAAVQSGVGERCELIAATTQFQEHPMLLRTQYTGIAAVDRAVLFLVVAFMQAASGWDQGFFAFTQYFLTSFFPIVTVWAVESCRERNARAWTRYTFVFALFYQTVGGAIIIPIYYLFYLYDTSDSSYWSKSPHVPVGYAKALLPAVLIGYFLPTVLMFLPYSSPNMWTTQAMVALWQPCPWFVDSLIYILSKIFSSSSTPRSQKSGQLPSHRHEDVVYLQYIYGISFFVTFLSHVSTVSLMLFSKNPDHSFSHMFLHPTSHASTDMTLVQGMLAIFQADFWIIFASSVLWAYLAILDAKRVGLSDVNVWTAGVMLAFGSVLVGPGAVVAGVWYWREGRMVEAEEKMEKEKTR